MPGPIIAIPRRMNYGRPAVTRIGPWQQGVMLRYDPEQVGNSALQYASNVDVLPNGQLKQRPPIKNITNKNAYCDDATIIATGANTTGFWSLDATYVNQFDAVISHTTDLVGIAHDVNFAWVTFTRLNHPSTPANNLLGKFRICSSNIVVYNGQAWGVVLDNAITGSLGVPGQVWSVTLNNVAAGVTLHQIIPTLSATRGPCAISIIKDRMYAYNYVGITQIGRPDQTTNVNTVTFSATGDPGTVIPATSNDSGFFKISGSNITDAAVTAMAAIRNTVYIFTPNATWVLTLPSTGVPTNGVLSLASDHIGAWDYNCVATYDNKVFVLGQAGIYEILNGTFTDIGYVLGPRVQEWTQPSNLTGGSTLVSLSVALDRIWLGVTNSGGTLSSNTDPPTDNFFIYNLKSRAWSSYIHPSSTNFVTLSVLQFAHAFTGQVAFGTGVTQDFLQNGALMMDASTGIMFITYDLETDNLINHANTVRPYADLPANGGSFQSIPIVLWTQDIDGATVETASWKRFYTISINLYTTKYIANTSNNQTLNLTLTDHNGNDVSNAQQLVTTVPGQTYYSIKQYTSLRARHLQYKITFDPKLNGPFSVVNLDVLSKVKETIQSGAIGG